MMADRTGLHESLEYSYSTHCPIPNDGNTIRLVRIARAHRDQPLCIAIERYTPSPIPTLTYDALSYVWGDQSTKVPISCDGSVIYVTTNLHAALVRFRNPMDEEMSPLCLSRPLQPRVSAIWIDALCIDQVNISERTAQVRIMGQIYSGAERVIVWLGDEDDESRYTTELAFVAVEVFAGNRLYDGSKQEYVLPGDPLEKQAELFCSVLRRPWFSRTWVFQEFVLARDALLMCGPHTISFDLLAEAVVALLFSYTFVSGLNKEAIFGLHLESTQSMAVARMKRNDYGRARQELARETRTLKRLLMATRSNSATDPRDKADYSKSVAEVYIEAAWTLIEETQSLEVLTLTGSAHRVEDLPSWVPDWRKPCRIHTIAWGEDRKRSRYHASSALDLEIIGNADASKLTLLGLQFDTVKRVLHGELQDLNEDIPRKAAEGDGPGDDVFHTFRAQAESHGLVGTYAPTAEPMGLAYLRTLCADLLPEGGRISDEFSKLWFPAYMQYYMPSNPTERRDLTLLLRTVEEIMTKVRRLMEGRCLVMTTKNHLALVPESAREGDRICIVGGGDAPLLLRPSGDGFEYLGECYVHGIMNGEFVMKVLESLLAHDEEPEYDDSVWEEFTLT